MDILWFIIIGIVAGWIASVIMRGHGYGLVGDLVIGIVGAVIGGTIFRAMGIAAYGTFGSLAMAVIGAIVLLAVGGFLRRTTT